LLLLPVIRLEHTPLDRIGLHRRRSWAAAGPIFVASMAKEIGPVTVFYDFAADEDLASWSRATYLLEIDSLISAI